jgi:Na+-driven multidrug efflux pump
MPKGQEIAGAAIATLISNIAAMAYLLFVYIRVCKMAPISADIKKALEIGRENLEALFSVGIPSALLTGLLDVANMYLTILAAAHGDLVVAGIGIVMKVERVPNAINIGLCQGMLPIVAFNYSAKNHSRLKETIRTARTAGLAISFLCILLFELFANPTARIFLSTSADSETALRTIAYASVFLRIRCLASPVQLINYHTSYCMQAMGKGKETLLHAFVRELVFYIPLMFILDRLFGETGLAAALPAGEGLAALFALWLLHRTIHNEKQQAY